MLDHVGRALLPLLAFTAAPHLISGSLRFVPMPSVQEDEYAERSDSFYRPAMTAQEKEAFYGPISRPTAREGKRTSQKAHIRCSSSDAALEHSHGSRTSRPHRKRSSSRSKSESRRHHLCRHRRSKNEQLQFTLSKTVKENAAGEMNSSAHLSQLDQSTVTDSGYHQNTTSLNDSKKLSQQWADLELVTRKCQELEVERNALQGALAETVAQLREYQTNDAELVSLQQQNKQLEEDVMLLKGTVYRLNAELEKYQNRLRALRKAQNSAGYILAEAPAPPDPNMKPTPMASNMLGPLLEAYQETILEKETALEASGRDVATYAQNCRSARQEIEELKTRLEDAQLKNEEITDLKDKLKKAHQKSDSLLQSLHAEQSHLQNIKKKHQQEVSALDGRARSLEEKLTECHTELLTLRGRYSVLSEQYERLQQGADRLIPMSVHNAAVSECKRLFEELKAHYESERERFTRKIASLEAEKPRLETALETHATNFSSLEATNRALEKMLRHCQQRNDDLCARLVSAHVSRDSAKRQLQRSLTMVKELVSEQERLVHALQERQHESQSVARLGNTLVTRVGSLKAQLENVQRGAYEELGVVEKIIRERAEGAARNEQCHQQEIQQLRGLLRQKEQFISRLQRDKSKTEESLEIVWQAATTEKPLLKEKLLTTFPESGLDSHFDGDIE